MNHREELVDIGELVLGVKTRDVFLCCATIALLLFIVLPSLLSLFQVNGFYTEGNPIGELSAVPGPSAACAEQVVACLTMCYLLYTIEFEYSAFESVMFAKSFLGVKPLNLLCFVRVF